jgi:hypothetical protein
MAYFRVTVEDLETGEKESIEVSEDDYILNTFGSCYLDGINQYANGTVQLTIRGHRPTGKSRQVEGGER